MSDSNHLRWVKQIERDPSAGRQVPEWVWKWMAALRNEIDRSRPIVSNQDRTPASEQKS